MHLIDYHVHPGYSIDAQDVSINQYCQRAVEIGLAEICFTPHYELDPLRSDIDWFVRVQGKIVSMTSDWLKYYFEDICLAREKYGHKLIVKAGIEVGFDHDLEEPIEQLLDKYSFDFVMGSVHCLDHVAISSHREYSRYYEGKTAAQICRDYFSTMGEAVKSGLFDVIGHFDLYRRYGSGYFGPEMADIQKPYIEEILPEIVRRGIGLEVNTSGIRKGGHGTYPTLEIIKQAEEAGITIFTTGSDAHRLEHLGSDIPQVQSKLDSMGISLSTFFRRKPYPICPKTKDLIR